MNFVEDEIVGGHANIFSASGSGIPRFQASPISSIALGNLRDTAIAILQWWTRGHFDIG